MPEFELVFAGEEYIIDAKNIDEAENKLAAAIGQQSAESMVPSAVDFGEDDPKPKENVFGDTTAKAMEAPLEAMKYYAGQTVAPDQSILDRGKSAGLTALTGLATGLSGASGLAAETIAPLGNPIRRALDMPTLDPQTAERRLASDFMMGLEVAVPELTGATSAGARLGKQIGVGKTPIARREFGEMTDTMKAARNAEELNILPSAGMQGQGAAVFEAGVEVSPFGSGTILKGRERVQADMENALSEIATRDALPTTPELAGIAVQKGAEKFKSSFMKKSEELYEKVGEYIKPETSVQAPNTINVLEEIVSYSKDSPEIAKTLGLSKYQNILKGLKGGDEAGDAASEAAAVFGEVPSQLQAQQIPYSLLKDLRSTIGEQIGNTTGGVLNNMSQGKLKQLYGALSNDMESIARANGKEAFAAFNKANRFYQKNRNIIDKKLKDIFNTDSGSQAYNAMTNLLKAGNNKQSTAKLIEVKKALPKEEFNTFKATLVQNLGLATKGNQNALGDVFSGSTFLTNYNGLDKSARRVLMGDAAPELEKLASVVEMARNADRAYNVSRTAPALATQSILTGVAAFGGAGATTIGMANTAKLLVGLYIVNRGSAGVLTNTKFLKALNALAKDDRGLMQKLAGGDGFIAAEAKTLLRAYAAQQTKGLQEQ